MKSYAGSRAPFDSKANLVTMPMLAEVIGVAGALALRRVIAVQLYGVSATDATVFVAVPVVIGAIALIAALLPARVAAKVDPLTALREG